MKTAALLNSQKESEGGCLRKCHYLEELKELSQKLLQVRKCSSWCLAQGDEIAPQCLPRSGPR